MSNNRERACIKCGVVDTEDQLLSFHSRGTDEESKGEDTGIIWAHRQCWRRYQAALQGLEFIDFQVAIEKLEKDKP